MRLTNRISLMRLAYEILIGLLFIAGSALLCYLPAMLFDQIICVVALNACFALLFILTLIHNRLKGRLKEEKYTSYGKVAFITFLMWAIIILSLMFAPEFFAPVMLLPLIGSVVYKEALNNVVSIYFVMLLCIAQNQNLYVCLGYIVCVLFGTIISSFLNEDNALEKLYAFILAFCLNTLVSVIFYYFTYLDISKTIFIYAFLDSLIICLAAAIIVPLFSRSVKLLDTTDFYEMILDEGYDLQEDIRKFSFIEYQHALRVSRLSRLCASKIAANELLAASAGIYYRIGKTEGEPMIDNAIRIANNHCFPPELITILSEYAGIIALPSTKESAIVHMVDTVVTKVELFDQDSMSSSWNQNMVIYQTINELSQKGFYDNSNLSMNEFLTIRETLANEDILA